MSYYRHEYKHEISVADMMALRARLSAVMRRDPNAPKGQYTVRSLYFDDLRDSALKEKINGVRRREKFRIRFYNGNTDYIVLEKKCKTNSLCHKEQQRLTLSEAQRLARGEYEGFAVSEKPLLGELCHKMKTAGLRPKTVVEYLREPFVLAPGNVRVTLDFCLRTGLRATDFLNPTLVTLPLPEAPIILEVKWDEFLPDMIRAAVSLTGRRTAAFSKYANCRIYE